MLVNEDFGNIRITCTEHVVAILFQLMEKEHPYDRDKEYFWVIGLNAANKVDYIDLVTVSGGVKMPQSWRFENVLSKT